MEFKGTKGKWYCYKKTDQHKIECIITDTQDVICDLPYYCNDYSDANAKLISCAPEMLDMLIKMKEAMEYLQVKPLVYDLKKLIKKATEI